MSHAESKFQNTTGHVWDEDLQEFNNPLPGWWLWTFYATIIFSIVYWVMYPSWPVAKGFLTGINQVEYVNEKGEKQTSHWNTRALLMQDMNEAAAKQKPFFDKIAATPFDQIKGNPELSGFVASAGKTLFQDNCAGCHQSGGQGLKGMFPNLTDDDWMYGGSYEQIQATITNGRNGMMPPKGGNPALTDAQVTDLANYVLTLAGEGGDATAAQRGKELFEGAGGCAGCHGMDGKGNQALGAANLTDKIWMWTDIGSDKVNAVKNTILAGFGPGTANPDRNKMPAWNGRLSEQQIKVLTLYVHDTLGGGK